MSKITEYTAETRLKSDDVLLKDGTGGTKKITAYNAAVEFAGLVSANNHRNIWRGKNIGTAVSAAQKTAIQNGTFDDMFIGDYWLIDNVTWRIADMDYWFNCGNTKNFTTHHLVIVPDTCLVSGVDAKMNDSDTTQDGYVGSKMYTTTMITVKKKVMDAFPDLVLTHDELLINAVTDGYPSAGIWVNSTVELMNEIMVYGCPIFTPSNNGTKIPYLYTIDNSQLSLFRLNPSMIKRRFNYWLRDPVSATDFANVRYSGTADRRTASSTDYGVRPAFPIGVAD